MGRHLTSPTVPISRYNVMRLKDIIRATQNIQGGENFFSDEDFARLREAQEILKDLQC